LIGPHQGNHEKRNLFRFDLSTFNGRSIDSAKVRVYVKTVSDPGSFEAHWVTGSWTESGVMWNNQPSYNSTATSTLIISSAGAYYEWEVNSDLQKFASGATGYTVNNGWLITTPVNATRGAMTLSSKENTNQPQLVVVYH
jgi:hypothetical protein